jgi:catechol 2,3-dioxygenase-like lactoylglutathione lyase family enzyme
LGNGLCVTNATPSHYLASRLLVLPYQGDELKNCQIRLLNCIACAVICLGCITTLAAELPAAKNTTAPAEVKPLAMMSTSIPSSNLERSIAFYTKGLGMTVVGRMDMGAVIEVPLDFPGGGANLILQYPKTAGTSLPIRGSLSRIILLVPDLKVLAAQLNLAGYQLKGKINELTQYKVAVAQLEDPDGNHIELIQRIQ